MSLKSELQRLDYNHDGRVNIADAEQLLADRLKGSLARAFALGAIVGGFVAGIIAAILLG